MGAPRELRAQCYSYKHKHLYREQYWDRAALAVDEHKLHIYLRFVTTTVGHKPDARKNPDYRRRLYDWIRFSGSSA